MRPVPLLGSETPEENEAQTIKAAQVSGIGLEMLNFKADQAAIEAWNGALSPINNSKPGQTFFVSPEVMGLLGKARK